RIHSAPLHVCLSILLYHGTVWSNGIEVRYNAHERLSALGVFMVQSICPAFLHWIAIKLHEEERLLIACESKPDDSGVEMPVGSHKPAIIKVCDRHNDSGICHFIELLCVWLHTLLNGS